MLFRRTPEPVPGDAGFSLMELVTTTMMMSIVTAVTTAAIVQIYRTVNQTEAEAEAQAQITAAFRRLDQEIRYARGVSTPDQLNGDHYVEYMVDLDDVATCVQLRLRQSTGELQRRQWTKNVNAPAPTPWTVLAAPATSATPFEVTAPDPTTLTGFRYQRLRVNVAATVGEGASAASRVVDLTFTALNATGGNNAGTCIEARGMDS
jgi:type II secretory pathway component PulJ